MRLAHIIEQVYHKPWLITPSMHASIRRLVESKLGRAIDEPKALNFSDFSVQRQPMQIDRNGIAHIHIYGVMGQGLAEIEKSCGACDTRDVRSELLAASESARAIFLEIESPGGMVNGTAETAAIVARIAEEMPVVAYTDSMVCSAAYWVASQADKIFASESATLGSIGVYIPWVDDSAMLEAMGIKLEAIANEGAVYKGLGFDPHLTEEQRAHLQEMVNRMASDFKGAITAKRDVPEEMMRGQTAYGIEALVNNLCDELMDRDAAKQRLLGML
jgi:signal peptide peptidase SppA